MGAEKTVLQPAVEVLLEAVALLAVACFRAPPGVVFSPTLHAPQATTVERSCLSSHHHAVPNGDACVHGIARWCPER